VENNQPWSRSPVSRQPKGLSLGARSRANLDASSYGLTRIDNIMCRLEAVGIHSSTTDIAMLEEHNRPVVWFMRS